MYDFWHPPRVQSIYEIFELSEIATNYTSETPNLFHIKLIQGCINKSLYLTISNNYSGMKRVLCYMEVRQINHS